MLAPGESPTWNAHIAPLFAAKCASCHGAGAMGGLNLTTYADAVKGGQSGPLFVSGNAAGSILIIKFKDGAHPFASLTPDELALLEAWINGGALEQ
jgi:mono/diheme cytochrome c family protein